MPAEQRSVSLWRPPVMTICPWFTCLPERCISLSDLPFTVPSLEWSRGSRQPSSECVWAMSVRRSETDDIKCNSFPHWHCVAVLRQLEISEKGLQKDYFLYHHSFNWWKKVVIRSSIYSTSGTNCTWISTTEPLSLMIYCLSVSGNVPFFYLALFCCLLQ